MSRILVLMAVVMLVLPAGPLCSAEQPSVEKIVDGEKTAKIDWTNLCYIAEGQGAMPSIKEQPNRARARLSAREYAKLDAAANLMMAVDGTTISYESKGKDFAADTTIRQEIKGFLRNAQVTPGRERVEKIEGDTIVIVEMRCPMFGNNGPANVLLREDAKKQSETSSDSGEKPGETVVETNVKVVLKPDKAISVSTSVVVRPSEESKPYTGLIVDASGYRLVRCMSPKIRRPDGSEVWGSVKGNWDELQERGIVAYATSLAAAKANARAGSNPLIIRACGRAGGRFFSDAIISDSDAEVLLAENTKCGFLDKFSVMFVKDPAL